jgi:uncharacterized membrane protein YbhN (UPF0104 family)
LVPEIALPHPVVVSTRYGWRRIVTGIAFCALSIAAFFLVARRLTSASWPLEEANFALVLAASGAYLASFGFRALGWQRVFPALERPDCARCLAACGAAAASGTVLPFRLDYLVKIAMLDRLRGVVLGLDTIVLSLVTLGMVDAAAMLPLALFAISTSGALFLAPLTVVVLFCISCVLLLVFGRRLATLRFLRRWRRISVVARRVGESSSVTRSTVAAGGLLLGCWTSRAFGSVLLLMALGAGFSPTFALVVLCLAAAASILPITAGGAVAGLGATAGILFALGASKDVAINFSLASALLLTIAAVTAAAVGVSGSIALALRRSAPA